MSSRTSIAKSFIISGRNVYDIIDDLRKEKILCISAGNNTLRICPPLIIDKSDIDIFINKLSNLLIKK